VVGRCLRVRPLPLGEAGLREEVMVVAMVEEVGAASRRWGRRKGGPQRGRRWALRSGDGTVCVCVCFLRV